MTMILLTTYADNFEHLLARDVAVPIEIVHAEGPLEFLLEFAPRGGREGA